MKRIVTALACFLALSGVAAQETAPPTLQQQEADESVQRFFSLTDKLRGMVTEMAVSKETQCMKAVGDVILCKCLGDHSPLDVDFVGYVAILSKTKGELNYEALSDVEKRLVDGVRASRDQCVAEAQAPRGQ
jgi:hypothetical protein